MTTKTPDQVLGEAADILERDGWTTREYHSLDGCHCALGAIGLASGYHIDVRPSKFDPSYATFSTLYDAPGASYDEARGASFLYLDAIRALSPRIGGNVGVWNDQHKEPGPVIAELRATAEAVRAAGVPA